MKRISTNSVFMVVLLQLNCGGNAADTKAGGERSSGASDSGRAPADGAPGSGGAPADASTGTLHIRGLVDIEGATYTPGAGTGIPCVGAQMCVYGNDALPCATSGSDGTFDLSGVPAHSDIAVSFVKEGYIPVLRPIRTADGDVAMAAGDNTMYADHGQTAERDRAGKGDLDFFAIYAANRYAAGVRVATVPDAPPVYNGADNVVLPSATETISGLGYVRLAPGEVRITFQSPTGNCIALGGTFGWPGSQPNEARAPIVAGFDTNPVGAICPDAPPAKQLGDSGAPVDAGKIPLDAGKD